MINGLASIPLTTWRGIGALAEVSLMREVPDPPVIGTLDREKVGENPYLFC